MGVAVFVAELGEVEEDEGWCGGDCGGLGWTSGGINRVGLLEVRWLGLTFGWAVGFFWVGLGEG